MQFQMEKAYILQRFQQFRIIQPNVVFIHGLPTSLAHPGVLEQELAPLGSIGRVSLQHLSKDFYSAFVLLEQEVTAALLIWMLNQLRVQNRTLRVFYGSTKFCPHFLKNHRCLMSECNYAHYYMAHLTHLRDQAKDIDHIAIASLYLNYYSPQTMTQANLLASAAPHSLLGMAAHRLDHLTQQLQTQCITQSCCQTQTSSYIEEEPEIVPTEVEWHDLEKEIESKNEPRTQSLEDASGKGQEEEGRPQSKIQQFLDGAQRILTKLIFDSSLFVY